MIRPRFGCGSAPDGPCVTRLTLTGELDLASVPQLWAALASVTQDAELVIVDLTGLTFMDSAGVSTILAVHDQLRDEDRWLALIPGQRQVKRIFELTGLADALPFTNDDPVSRNGNSRLPQPTPPAATTISAKGPRLPSPA